MMMRDNLSALPCPSKSCDKLNRITISFIQVYTIRLIAPRHSTIRVDILRIDISTVFADMAYHVRGKIVQNTHSVLV